MPETEQPQRYGRCLVEREIGRGARSSVFLAWHEGLQIPVAVKVMRKEGLTQEEHYSERFLREARIAAQLTHPNIVRVYDCGETDTAFYLVLEYIEGESCKDRMVSGAGFDWQTAVRIVRQVADGLNYASRKGIIHRDLKPENIMIDRDGSARIADLGLAKEVGKGRGSATADGDVLGTPYYMSPEQVRQPGDVDFRSDIYSLGATLYHMATGQVPYEAPTPFEIMTMHLNEPLIPPQERRHDLPAGLNDTVVRAMAKEPQNRYQSYADLMRDLDALLTAQRKAPDAYMAAIEETLDQTPLEEEPAVASVAMEQAPEAAVESARESPPAREALPPPPRPLARRELPVTRAAVLAKVMGLLAVCVYALFLVCLYYLLQGLTGVVPAGIGLAVALGLSGWLSYHVAHTGVAEGAEAEHPLEEHLSTALSWVCERTDLPTPRIRISARQDAPAHAYSLFTRKAALDLPGGWLARAGLNGEQTKAFLAQGLAHVYTGDSDLRALLAPPVTLLVWVRVGLRRVVELVPHQSARSRARLAQALAVAGLVAACGAIAALLQASVLAGILGVLFFALMLLISSFERHSLRASDAFTAKVMGSREAVKALVAVAGLTGPERYRFVAEALGPAVAGKYAADLPPPDERRELIQNLVGHCSAAAHLPTTLDTVCRLLSDLPSPADRLNRLALLPEGRSWVLFMVALAKVVHARLLGVSPKARMNLAELAGMRAYALIGAVGGLLAVAGIVFVFLHAGGSYAGFVALLSCLGAVTGLGVAYRNRFEGTTPGRLGWATVVSAVAFAATTMLGLCFIQLPGAGPLAIQLPLMFVMVLLLAASAGALFVRYAPAFLGPVRSASADSGSATHYTFMVPAAEKEALLRSTDPFAARGRSSARCAVDSPAPLEPSSARRASTGTASPDGQDLKPEPDEGGGQG